MVNHIDWLRERKYHLLPMVSETKEGKFEGFLDIDNNETRTSEKHTEIFDTLGSAVEWVKKLQAQKINELLKTVSLDDIDYYAEPQIAGNSLNFNIEEAKKLYPDLFL